MPLVKFFHCVSFLNQTLLQSSSSRSFFLFRCLIHILLLPFSASFHFLSFFEALSLFPVSLFHFKPCHSLCFFFLFLSSHLQIPSSLFFILCYPLYQLFTLPPPALKPFLLFCPFLYASQSHLLGCCSHACKPH